jgi:hypothetical protein
MERRGRNLHIEAMPLNNFLIEIVTPIIVAAAEISWEKTRAALKDIKQREDTADINMIEDVMHNAAVPFGGNPVSYGKQGCRTNLIDKKIEAMQKHWYSMISRANTLGRGLSARDRAPE